LERAECDKDIVLVFKSKESFEYATKAWGWVNDEETHKFILIANHGGCAPEDQRQGYLINDVEYDFAKRTAHLRGEKTEWSEVAQNMDIIIGTTEVNQDNTRRTWKRWELDSPVKSVIFKKNFKGNLLDEPGAKVDADTTFTGELQHSFVLSYRLGEPVKALAKLKLKNFDATTKFTAQVGLSSGPLAYMRLFSYLEKPIWRTIKIKNWFKLGFFWEQLFFFGLAGLEQRGSLKFGTTATLSDDAVVTIDLLKTDGAQDVKGWRLKTTDLPSNLDYDGKGVFSGGMAWYIYLAFHIYKLKLEAGIYAKLPDVLLFIDGTESKGSPCALKKKKGTGVDLKVGASFNGRVGTAGSANVLGIPLTDPLFDPWEGNWDDLPLVSRSDDDGLRVLAARDKPLKELDVDPKHIPVDKPDFPKNWKPWFTFSGVFPIWVRFKTFYFPIPFTGKPECLPEGCIRVHM
jgi:hypothetical protein